MAFLSLALSGPWAAARAEPYLTRHSKVFAADSASSRRERLRLGGAGEAAAMALDLVFAHELGHEFERAHGRPLLVSSEDFADRFAVNLVAGVIIQAPVGLDMAEVGVGSMQRFIASASPQDHFGSSDRAQEARREDLYKCSYLGYVYDFSRENDPYSFIFRSTMGFSSDMARQVEKSGVPIGKMPAREYFKEISDRQAEAIKYLKAQKPVGLLYYQGCGASAQFIVNFILQKVNTGKRLEEFDKPDPTSQYPNWGTWQFDADFQYERPQTPGAKWIFAIFAPLPRGAAPNALGYYAYLRRIGWLSRDGKVILRLKYCGIGMADAQITHSNGAAIITVCYEIGEHIVENIALWRSGEELDRSRTRSFMERLAPDMMHRTLKAYGLPTNSPRGRTHLAQ